MASITDMFEATFERIRGCWFRTDTKTGITMRVLNIHDFSRFQMRPHDECAFCKSQVLHSEEVHDNEMGY